MFVGLEVMPYEVQGVNTILGSSNEHHFQVSRSTNTLIFNAGEVLFENLCSGYNSRKLLTS